MRTHAEFGDMEIQHIWPNVMKSWLVSQDTPIYEELERLKKLMTKIKYATLTIGRWESKALNANYRRLQETKVVDVTKRHLYIMRNTFQELIDGRLISNIDKVPLYYLNIG